MSTSRASSPTAGHLDQPQRADQPAHRQAVLLLAARRPRGLERRRAGRPRPAAAGGPSGSTSTAPSTSGSASTAQVSRATVPALHPRHVHGEHRHQVRAAPGTGRARRAARPRDRRRGGSSRVQVTGRDVGTCSADHDHLERRHRRGQRRARAGSRPSISIEALSTPPIRAAVPPASTTAPSRSGPPGERHPAPVWQAGAGEPPLRLALVQQASSLDPAENRDALADVAERLEPDTGLVLLPEAFMRDFGSPGSDLGGVRRAARRARSCSG